MGRRRFDFASGWRHTVLIGCGMLSLTFGVLSMTPVQAQTADTVPCDPIRWNGRYQMDYVQDDVLKWLLPIACELMVDVPPVPVFRRPFPRGLVNSPTTMTLSAKPVGATAACGPLHFAAQRYLRRGDVPPYPPVMAFNHAVCSRDPHPHPPPCDGDVKNYEVDFWWGRLETGYTERPYGDPGMPCWDWGDGKGQGACGLTDKHSYQAASNTGNRNRGITILTNGPRADLLHNAVVAWNQESYQVTVPTYWALYFAEAYQVARVSFSQDRGVDGKPTWTPHTQWSGLKMISWRAVDLRRFGNATWFWTSYRQFECQDTSDGSVRFAGPTCQSAPGDPAVTNTLPANIIDVQNVLCPANRPCNEQRPE